ncbi:MAG: tetratricopeptide repeat protein [Limisphaerales bacterium]
MDDRGKWRLNVSLREGENMNQSDAQPSANYVTCRCQYCDKGIEFDASTFEKGETRTVPCPHCGLETIIFVPENQRVPPVIAPPPLVNEAQLDTPEAYSMVLKWYRKAAEKGDAEYQCQLATEIMRGRGLAQNYAEAAEWFLKAAAQGHALAQFNAGVCYWNGHGVL